ncbi:hypothetical protein [Tenacibaculum sp. 190524A02b]|uniref:Uncharacterized protein n=1 Tax=Tenacibaculum vairaonense TaxID=3137860 RepID=A0ABP1F9C5_9FLAO
MLKNILKLGKALNKKESQSINGQGRPGQDGSDGSPSSGGACSSGNWCPSGQICKCDDNDCKSGTCIKA